MVERRIKVKELKEAQEAIAKAKRAESVDGYLLAMDATASMIQAVDKILPRHLVGCVGDPSFHGHPFPEWRDCSAAIRKIGRASRLIHALPCGTGAKEYALDRFLTRAGGYDEPARAILLSVWQDARREFSAVYAL